MTPIAALIELLARVGATQGAAVYISGDELRLCPPVAVAAMKAQGLIAKARPATSVVCPGCERACVMPVNTLKSESRNTSSFVVCDKRDDINRVPIAADQMVRWRCDANAVCKFIATSLGLRQSESKNGTANYWQIGMAAGDKRKQLLCLKAEAVLTLAAGDRTMPLAVLVEYLSGKYSIDGAMIRQLVDSVSIADKRYTATNARREARKLDTQSLHENWRKAYRILKKKNSDKSDVWCSQQIAKMEIANNRRAGTIKKNMKP